jgi:hypothetical protein
MGKISSGILGGFSGKVGNVIGGSWKGIDYMRIKPASVANPRTEGQVDQRTKFRTVLNFLQPSTGFVQVGFRNYAIEMTSFNAAMSYNLQNALTGSYPNYSIDMNQALLSRGKLTGFDNPQINRPIASEIELTWNDNSTMGNAKSDDQIGYLFYYPDRKESVYAFNENQRSSGFINMQTPSQYSGETAHVFLIAVSADGKLISNSAYLGSTVI